MDVMLYLRHFPAAGEPLVGGTAMAVAGLARGLAESGARVTLLCEGEARSRTALAPGLEVECFPRRGGARSFALGDALRSHVYERLRTRRGLCLLNGMFHPGVYALGAFLRRYGLPYVVAPHGSYEPAAFRRNAHLKWPYWYLFERSMLRGARAVQVLDMRHARFLRRLGVGTRVIEAPNGVAPDAVPEEQALPPPAVVGPVRAVFLGRIDAYTKGLDVLLDAVAQVAADDRIELTLQGPDQGDRSRLEGRARALGIAGQVRFRAPEYRGSPVRLLAEHDLVCLPSRCEGFGLAALEAMIAGRVLLVSARAGIAPHVEASGAGVLVAPAPEDVARGLGELLRRRASWPDMGRQGRRYALARLRWRDIAAAALGSYAGLLD
ncbi:MAG: glycosyltransferase [Betaproteobacteria bacterium]|nr:glycosyltransferase [Betaproteobacteria bacterium]